MFTMKFEDCPYHCNEGKVLDANLRKLVPCPHCHEKKKELAEEGLALDDIGNVDSLPRILGIDNKYLKTKFVYDSVIPEGERLFLEDESIKKQGDMLEEIYLGLSVGELPSRSYCIGLGNKGRIDRLAYPMLSKAYLSGLSVAKFISCSDYNRLCVAMSSELEQYYNRDFVMMLIPDGASKADIACAKGLMQTRALKGKSTVFITTWSIEACSILLGYYGDDTHFMATGVFVEYKHSKHANKSYYIQQLTGVENSIHNDESPVKGSTMTTMADLLNS